MAPRVDQRIPRLVTATETARRLGCSKTVITARVRAGDLVGIRVGRQLLLAERQVNALARQRERGVAGWRAPGRPPTIPALVSTGETAVLLGFADDGWPRELYHRGDLPGRKVGLDIVFRRATVNNFVILRELEQSPNLQLPAPGS